MRGVNIPSGRLDIVKKRKIIFFIYQMGSGGAARTFLNILNNIDHQRFAPVLVTLDYNGNYEAHIREDVKFIKLNTRRLRSAILPLSKVIREEKADIVFSTIPNYNIVALLATMLSRTAAKNIVREAAYLGGSKKENLKLKFAGFLYKRASKVVALSKGVKENIIRRYGVPADKIEIIYNPVDVEGVRALMQVDDVEERHKEIFRKHSQTIITAGRFHPDKDQKTLIRAFRLVKEEFPDAGLMILGEGALEGELRALAEQLNITDAVHFAGFQKNPYAYFAQSDLFVLSSTREGFGHVLTEALAAGTPVVSTKAQPGAAEVLDNGRFGEMCMPSDPEALAGSILYMLSHDEEREWTAAKGIERARRFHADKIVREYEALFISVLDQ